MADHAPVGRKSRSCPNRPTTKRSHFRSATGMTSIKQIEANRRNARLSTGPRTVEGRARSSRNAIRHGLTAETVVAPLEDLEDYTAFELAITADFEARTAVERELVLRLSNLLWRLRRATTIETGLLQVQAAMLAKQRQADRAEYNECHTSQDDRTLGSQAVTISSFQVKTSATSSRNRALAVRLFDGRPCAQFSQPIESR